MTVISKVSLPLVLSTVYPCSHYNIHLCIPESLDPAVFFVAPGTAFPMMPFDWQSEFSDPESPPLFSLTSFVRSSCAHGYVTSPMCVFPQIL